MDNEELLRKFGTFINNNLLFKPEETVLLAVSGGMDSMFMAWLFKSAAYSFAIAHCNFQLRDQESNGDEAFVKEWAMKNNVPFYVRRFDTKNYALSKHLSIQMAARTLRYAWFEEVMADFHYSVLALGQHLGDSTETMLINLIRGTGISGLHGIKEKNGKHIRPIMFLTREEIASFIALNQIPFREDSSNSSTYYLRNLIRHKVIPLMRSRNPSLDETFSQTAKRLRTAEKYFIQKVEELKKSIITQDGSTLIFSIVGLQNQHDDAAVLLDEWLSPYKFTFKTTEAISANLGATPGTVYHSETHTISFDRGYFILEEKNAVSDEKNAGADEKKSLAEENKSLAEENINFRSLFELKLLKSANGTMPWELSADDGRGAILNMTAYLDACKLEFPLKARFWEEGDYIVPFGMKGRKKLSDLFTDLKIPLYNKKKIPLVISGNNIVWVAGIRLNEEFKCEPSTKWILQLSYNASKKKS